MLFKTMKKPTLKAEPPLVLVYGGHTQQPETQNRQLLLI